jgi:hypothetical protein
VLRPGDRSNTALCVSGRGRCLISSGGKLNPGDWNWNDPGLWFSTGMTIFAMGTDLAGDYVAATGPSEVGAGKSAAEAGTTADGQPTQKEIERQVEAQANLPDELKPWEPLTSPDQAAARLRW